MKRRKRVGYIMALVGTVILGCNAFAYWEHKEVATLAAVIGLMLFIVGAGLVSRAVKEKRMANGIGPFSNDHVNHIESH